MDAAWLDGWLGALLAAAVTVGATVAWEARAHRRALLDDTLAAMAAAADELGIAVLSLPREQSGPVTRPLMTALTRAAALAERPVGILPAKYGAPARWRLGMALRAVMEQFAKAFAALADNENEGAPLEMARLCATCSALAWTWWRRPLAYLRGDVAQRCLGYAEGVLADE